MVGIAADEADRPIKFNSSALYQHGGPLASSVSSLEAGSLYGGNVDPFDFSPYMDQAPLTVLSNSPLELVQQFFTKLGARYVVVTDADGYCMCPDVQRCSCSLADLVQTKASSTRRRGSLSCPNWKKERSTDGQNTNSRT